MKNFNKIIILVFLFIIINYQLIISEEKITIGKSINNQQITLFKYGYGKEIIIIIAGIHGNESNTSKTVMLLKNILDKNETNIPYDKQIWLIPELNPDGILKNKRLNSNNVDLNRNFFTDDWQPFFYYKNLILHAGIKPFSEPETAALKDYLEKIEIANFPLIICLHSSGDAVIPGSDSYRDKKLASLIRNWTNYSRNKINYNTSGELTAWSSQKLNIPSVTIEFKTKVNTELNELLKIINSFLKISIKENFYNNNGKSNSPVSYDDLLNDLPINILHNIIKDDISKENFFKIFNNLKKNNELLLYINKKLNLTSSYVPEDLSEIPKEYTGNKNKIFLRKIIINDLFEMMKTAKNENINLFIISGYRSFDKQKDIYENWIKTLGEQEANRVSASPGASQHQLGTTIDFNSLDFNFAETKEGKWLANNSYKFGFILSYPQGREEITGYRYEPWHYRYIGTDAAFIVYNYFNNSLELFLKWYWDIYIN
ncbi:MAG: DUF2817 domain-containing protein [Spirochaetes bacterium]|nr:DUF2817 domain-containing protein [Spirochaetota bacterium]